MSFLTKKAPVWAVLLSALAATGLITLAFMALPSLSDATQANRDFSISTSSSPVTVQQGSTATSTITLTSISSFDVATALSTTISPPTSGLTVSLSPSVVTPSANAKATSTITINTLPSTQAGTYTVTVTGTGGTKTHTTTLTVTVTAAPDFFITTSPASLIVPQNNANTTTLTLNSVGSFTGNVSLTMTVPFASLGVAGGKSPLHLTSGGTNTTVLAVYATTQTPLGSYAVSVTAMSGSLIHTISIPVTVKNGTSGCAPLTCGVEALNLEAYFLSSSTNTTLYLRNTGSSSITLMAYYVKDPSGDQWVNLRWNGPTISPNNVAGTTIIIGTTCRNCTIVGTPFSFSAGNSYTILVVTARNNQFTFTITPSTPIESLNLGTYNFYSNTNVTLYVRNSGSASVRLTTYYVQDTSGDIYTRTSWTGPSIPANATLPVIVTIGPSCAPNCSLTGLPFNFTSGHSYTLTFATANSNQFPFTIYDNTGTEYLNLDSFAFVSGTNVTLYIRNAGSGSVSLVRYVVGDTSNDTYSRTWQGPTIPSNSVVPLYILIGSSCGNCTLTGTAFTFMSGSSYTITLFTAANNRFTFTVVR